MGEGCGALQNRGTSVLQSAAPAGHAAPAILTQMDRAMLSNRYFDTEQIRAQDRHWIRRWENFETAGTVARTIIARWAA